MARPSRNVERITIETGGGSGGRTGIGFTRTGTSRTTGQKTTTRGTTTRVSENEYFDKSGGRKVATPRSKSSGGGSGGKVVRKRLD